MDITPAGVDSNGAMHALLSGERLAGPVCSLFSRFDSVPTSVTTASAVTLYTNTVAGDKLAEDGDVLSGRYCVTCANTADRKLVHLDFNSTMIGTYNTGAASGAETVWMIDYSIIRTSETTLLAVVSFSINSLPCDVQFTELTASDLEQDDCFLYLKARSYTTLGDIVARFAHASISP